MDEAERADNWPDWQVGNAQVGELARFVDPGRAGDLVPETCRGPWDDPEEGVTRARHLYHALRDRRIPYARQPWSPAIRPRTGGQPTSDTGKLFYQRIRSQPETVQGSATCLDLAILYAGMALAADMRPFIAFRDNVGRHALVLIDTSTALSNQTLSHQKQDHYAGPAGFRERPGDRGVWEREDAGRSAAPGNWLAVDVFRAARRTGSGGGGLNEAASFDVAISTLSAEDVLTGDIGEWALVDVSYPHSVYTPPAGRSIPAIHGYLPGFPAYIDYPSRADLLEKLLAQIGPDQPPAVLVLRGESGLGKSMLANQLAVAADHGCGWFLNATDRPMLTRSLAQAERQEKGQRDERPALDVAVEKPDATDDQAYASGALQRLRDAVRPWVVVLDNCDSDPRPDLLARIPLPHSPGQFVIITTTNAKWGPAAEQRGWQVKDLPGLTGDDLEFLELPPDLDGAIDGRPLIAQVFARLDRPAAAETARRSEQDGPWVVWDLIRDGWAAQPSVLSVARLLAWSPRDAISVAALAALAGPAADQDAVGVLSGTRLADPSSVAGEPALRMHGLFAAAVREQTWRDAPDSAAEAIGRLMSAEEGRQLFMTSADTTALGRLEPGDDGAASTGEVARAALHLHPASAVGLLWYGLGHIRERRGPVKVSGPYFEQAEAHLDAGTQPFEVAESMIGRARIVFQNKKKYANGQRREARDLVTDARRLLAPLPGGAAGQLSEQGNALSWLLAQQIADTEPDPRSRELLLIEVRENLWRSYEARLHIIRGGNRSSSRAEAPELDDGLGPERAFYNLAGVNIQLAKTHFELANQRAPESGERAELMAQVANDLNQATFVYEHVGTLRRLRYRGQAHPHLAACVQGQAYVPYFRAVLLGRTGDLAEALRLAAEALEQRRIVASGLIGPGEAAVLSDSDVAKSVDFMLKVSLASVCARSTDPAQSRKVATSVLKEAFREALGDEAP